MAVALPAATQDHILDQAMLAVYEHHMETAHPLHSYINVRVLEYVCYTCGQVLFEGPEFVDWIGGREWMGVTFPRRSGSWLTDFARRVARERQ